MAFWNSNEDEKKKEEMEELKRRVEGKETKLPEPPKLPEAGEPVEESEGSEEEVPTFEEPTLPTSSEQPEAPEMEEELPTARKVPGPKGDEDFAPLFVKIDKYKQVLQNLEEVKNTLQDLRDLFALMNEVDEIKREGMKELRGGISELADTLISMDEKFIRPEGTEDMLEEQPSSGVSKTVQKLQDDLRGVRQEIDRLE